jgi:hypothetical protein
MAEKCELLEKCGFFQNFKLNSDVVKNGWISLYCEDQVKAEKCERKKIRKATGKPPADNMAPTGTIF